MKEKHHTPGERYAVRAAQRLKQLLDDIGAPLDLVARHKVLAQKTGLTEPRALQTLGGRVPWDWEVLEALCSAFEKEPGYFLDETPGPPLPSDTRILTSVDGDENIVFRPPTGFLSLPEATGRWRYGAAQSGVMFKAASLVVFAEWPGKGQPLRPGTAYALRSDDGVSFLRCEEIKGNVAHFSDGVPTGLHHVLPIIPRRQDVGPRVVGPVLATIERQ